MAYTYDPSKISEAGKDRMRFELGDTAVTEQTAALSDEEITAVLGMYPGKWKRAKLALVESVCRRFSFEVNTEIGGLSLGLQARAEAWQHIGKAGANIAEFMITKEQKLTAAAEGETK